MKTFKELEKEHDRIPIRFSGREATGTLALKGGKTLAVLTGPRPIAFDEDPNGWFDVRIETGRGAEVLLHNALVMNSTSHLWGEKVVHGARIYPNVVAVDAGALSDGRSVGRIHFALAGLEKFFHYGF